MATYNGHRSWNAWNISLWINNDEGLYRHARELVEQYGMKRAVRMLTAELDGETTPDGGRYNATCIREALVGIAD